MSHSDAYRRFKASKQIGYEQWHDGEGYDMEAFAAMTSEERAIEVRLALAASDPDWRDLDILTADGGRECIERLRDLLLHDSIATRGHALSRLIDGGHTPGAVPDVQLAHIIDALPGDADHDPGMTQALYLAQQHAGAWSKLALLRGARSKPALALHFAAALLDMTHDCPDTAAFDPRFRPLLLRLLPDNAQTDREAAFAEVCRLMTIDVATIPADDDPRRLAWAERIWPRDDAF